MAMTNAIPTGNRRWTFGLGVSAAFVVSCSAMPTSYEIEGVGASSQCEFTGEFEGLFPCEEWARASTSPVPVTETFLRGFSQPSSLVVGVAASKSLDAIESSMISSYQIDGHLAIVRISDRKDSDVPITFVADDGSSSNCEFKFGDAQKGAGMNCDDWEGP